MNVSSWDFIIILLVFLLFFYFILESKGFKCQQCGVVRDKEEIVKIASEEKTMPNKAFVSLSNTKKALDMYLMHNRETILEVSFISSF